MDCPSEKGSAAVTLEKRLWDAADQFRANSGLKAQEYSGPILGLIFLRFAELRFTAQRGKLEKAGASSRRGSRVDEPAAYHAEGILYLSTETRFDYLLTLPEVAGIGAKINAAMRDIEKHNPPLAGVLPKTYNLFTSTLLKELLKKVSEIPASVDYDAFGRIYEYFLGEFARTEGQKGGEFYTPSSIVRLLTEVIEPFHGRILGPACGSGGMFVQSARFVAEHQNNPAAELAICGVEKTDETGRLCRLNLAVHGLEGDIRHGGNVNSYYDDPHTATGQFDFVLANPPFNVNAVDKERLKDMAGAGRRFPFGLPRTDNANYLWIQLFYSALNAKGRAGFVMANSASDARASEQEIRQKLIEARVVDVMVAVGPNMFYTVTLPCTLWFLDKGKASHSSPDKGRQGGVSRADTVLFIDARHIYRQVDRAHRDWTPAQIGFIANLVRLYRGEALDAPKVGAGETAANSDKADVRFIKYYMEILKLRMQNVSHGATQDTTQDNLSVDKLLSFDFLVPPLPIQQRIAGILSAYDELIENSQRRIRILESMARALYREWFVHFRFPGHENHPRVASPLGEIPQGWEVKRVTDAVQVNPRVVVPRDGEKPFVPMGCLSNDSMLISDIESRAGNSRAKFQNGDTLFARITPCLENGKTGFVQFLSDANAVAFGSTEFIVLRSVSLTPELVYCLARSDEFRGVAIKSMSGASGRQRVQEKCFDDFQMVQPPPELLEKFSAIVAPSFRLIYRLHLQIQNLRRTRDLLLPRLLSGQIEVEAA